MRSDDDNPEHEPARAGAKTRDYDVGYGKPPKHTQFGRRPQPHRHGTGNRPSRSPKEPHVAGLLDQLVEVKLGGQATKLHPHEAMLLSLFVKAARGQLQAIKQLIREFERACLLEPEVLQQSAVIHIPKDVPIDLAGYVFLREGAPPWDEATLRPYLLDYEGDLARLQTLKEEALATARAGGENVY
ncbi:hypothetical protein [Bradyrhizobium sp. 141]|uniref:hypothetical protein n=1 Tax=Bradyrhizobium sp. 141 TaxID=2782617 RepID=UPI001FF9CFE8|nr:hypothetical protein [Bradyrhizobium sp. 141]MCK1718705.1 hypothetical protein [Bradyrhizobium sp. 141]